MGIIGKDFKYKIVKNFLTNDEKEILGIYCEIKHRTNVDEFDQKHNKNGDTRLYGDPIMESLMLKKRKLMEKETGIELLPTYSFWRCYTKFADLEHHTDRPPCEISVTVNISNDGTKWPIYIDKNPVYLEPGDAAIYLGCELEHWRDTFEGDYSMQVFLHYVNKNGKYKDYHMDKRLFWGLLN